MMKEVRCHEQHYGSCACRPDVHGILIPGRRGRSRSVLYPAGGEGPHPTVLLCHGIPGCERNLDLAQAVRRAGGTLFREVTYPTDHFFADYRLAVAAAVTDFLRRLLPE